MAAAKKKAEDDAGVGIWQVRVRGQKYRVDLDQMTFDEMELVEQLSGVPFLEGYGSGRVGFAKAMLTIAKRRRNESVKGLGDLKFSDFEVVDDETDPPKAGDDE